MAAERDRAWRCSVCGYVHRGAAAPECCPVCGAAAADFEPFEAEPAAAPSAAPTRRRCLNCNYVHEGSEPPAECPVCGAPAERFEAATQPAPPQGVSARGGVCLVIGTGIAGVAAAESLRGAAPAARIVMLSKESRLPYYRLNLTRYLAGEIGLGTLPIHPESWYEENAIEVLCGEEAVGLDVGARVARLASGAEVSYDAAILAMGAHAFVPPIPGNDREGVVTLRTADDAEQVLAAVREGRECACIGGGVLGLETCGALARRGAKVTLLEGHGWLMPRQLNRRAGELLRRSIERIGITLKTEARTKDLAGARRVTGVQLEDGAFVPAGLVVLATGIRSNTHLARRAGLEVGNGIIVDNHMAASHAGVFAAGDAAEHHGLVYGTWAASQYQGAIAGLNAAGVPTAFGGIPRAHALKVLGLELLSIGKFEPEDGSYRTVERQEDETYELYVFRDALLVGAILLGEAGAGAAVKKAIESKRDCSRLLSGWPSARDVRAFLTE